MKYRVKWEIDSDADTPESAAKEAFEAMQRRGTTATIFMVTPINGGKPVLVDLLAHLRD
jgi:hypothetical protein